MKAYIGVARCCGAVTAAMLDDEHTTAKDVGDFARDMHKSGRILKHVDGSPMTIALKRCKCGKTAELQLEHTAVQVNEVRDG